MLKLAEECGITRPAAEKLARELGIKLKGFR